MALLTKVCSKCHRERLLTFYRRTTLIRGGYEPVCSICLDKACQTTDRRQMAFDYLEYLSQVNKGQGG